MFPCGIDDHGEHYRCSYRLSRQTAMIKTVFVLCLLVGSTLAHSVVIGQESTSNEPSYLLLQNGNVLNGQIRSEKERISVLVDANSNLYVATKQVLFIGPTLESLYQFQRSGVRQWGTGEHWQLAHWCIQQGLMDHAIEHFKALEQSASDSPRFKQLEHSLREALLADRKVQQVILSRRPSENPSRIEHPETEAVILTSAQSTLLKSSPTPKAELESADSWNKHEIPSYIRKTFQNSILPVLVSRCGQSGCHGMLGKSDFHIYQPLGEQSSILRTRDLDEVLKFIDRDRVQESALLAYATKAHGIQRNPSLSSTRADERALIERIQFWVKSLALSKKPETTMPAQYPSSTAIGSEVSSAVANVPTTSKSRRFTEREVEDRNAKLSKPARNAPPTEFLSMSEIAELEKAIEKFENQTGAAGSSPIKKDPFAPDVFNRKYH